MHWLCCNQCFDNFPLILGIVNVTPDSFSDGGQYFDPEKAIEHALQLAAEGAFILDLGGESSRPGATPVPLDEELKRVIPVIRAIRKQTPTPISIDTMKAEVARQAIAEGAVIVNDVSGLRDPAMVEVCAKTGAGVIVMHMKGNPTTMQIDPHYVDVVKEVDEFFAERIESLTKAGIRRESVCLDPGIGFGKKLPHTLEQLSNLKIHQRHGVPVCLGVSRKGFLGQITGRERHERLAATLAVNCFAIAQGIAQVLRVHDVGAHHDAVKIFQAISTSNTPPA